MHLLTRSDEGFWVLPEAHVLCTPLPSSSPERDSGYCCNLDFFPSTCTTLTTLSPIFSSSRLFPSFRWSFFFNWWLLWPRAGPYKQPHVLECLCQLMCYFTLAVLLLVNCSSTSLSARFQCLSKATMKPVATPRIPCPNNKTTMMV